jgi:hypothetical protein
MAVSAHGPRRGRPLARCDEGLRKARTCYDHLAGLLGVGLADARRNAASSRLTATAAR